MRICAVVHRRFGTPEYTRAAWATGQLTRRYNIPFRSSNTNASNCVDAQAAWESQMSLWGAVMGQAHIIKHAAGWLEGGLCASFEKFIIDIDMLQMMAETLKPLQVDESTLALDAIVEAGHGGHFFGTAHTMANYTTAFYEPLVSDWSNFETWAGKRRTNRLSACQPNLSANPGKDSRSPMDGRNDSRSRWNNTRTSAGAKWTWRDETCRNGSHCSRNACSASSSTVA